MITKLYSLIFCFIFVVASFAQVDAGWKINSELTPTFVDFSNNDKYLILENEKAYEVWNTESRTKILEGKYRNKLGRNFSGVYLTEGSAYLLFENEEIFLQIDYTINFTNVDAFDLVTGEKIWNIDNLDMQISTLEVLYQIASNAQRFVQNEERVGNAVFSTTTGVGTSNQTNKVPVSYVGHDEIVKKLISYMPEKNAIAVSGKESLQLLNLKTGEIIWEQEELKGAIGELFYEPNNDIIIAIRVNHGEFSNIVSRPEVQALNAIDGGLVWTLKYNGDFTPNTAYVYNDILVLPYFGLMLIDIKKGEELEGDVKDGMERQRKIQRNMSMLGTEGLGDNCSLPILDQDGILHYVVGFARSQHINPDGNKKAYLKIDTEKGKIVSAIEDIAKQGNRVIQEELTDDFFYLKLTQGLSNSYILALDKRSGDLVFETDKVKNRLGTDYDPFLLSQKRIIDVSSKGIHIHNTKNGKEVNFISHKKIGVGKFKNQLIFNEGFILLGTKGVAIIDNSGEVKKSFEDLTNIVNIRITEEQILFLEKHKLTRISVNPISIIEEIEINKHEQIHFSSLGALALKVNTKTKEISAF